MLQTIYFQKAVWENFQTEEKKSELVNRLLTEHYGENPVGALSYVERVKEIGKVIKDEAKDDARRGDEAVAAVMGVFPEAEVITPKKNWCKIHGMDKEYCKNMKH